MKDKPILLLKPKEAAEMLGVSVRALWNWDKEGKLQCHHTPGRHRRIPFSEVERLLLNK